MSVLFDLLSIEVRRETTAVVENLQKVKMISSAK